MAVVLHFRRTPRTASVAVGALGTAGNSILGPDGPMQLGAAHTTPGQPFGPDY